MSQLRSQNPASAALRRLDQAVLTRVQTLCSSCVDHVRRGITFLTKPNDDHEIVVTDPLQLNRYLWQRLMDDST